MVAKETVSDEIDLGQLFKLIGTTIDAFFNRIFNSIKSIYHVFILFVLFLKGHLLKFCFAGLLGVVIGRFLDYRAIPTYRSSMIVQPNFNSVQQLYSNIEFYNQLAKRKESKELAEVLDIPQSVAKGIKNLKIMAFTDEVQQIKLFNGFIKSLDSTILKKLDYQDYLENFSNVNAEFHKIEIETIAPDIAKKCQRLIVNSINNNEYFEFQKQANENKIEIKEDVIRTHLDEIDKLQGFYKELRIIALEAQKKEGITSINLGDNRSDYISEFELFKQIEKLKEEKANLNVEKANTRNTINIISEFPNKGLLKDDLWSKKIVQLPVLFVAGLFLILVLIVFNKYLENYKKKHNIR